MIVLTNYGRIEIFPPEDEWDSHLVYIYSHQGDDKIGFALNIEDLERFIIALDKAHYQMKAGRK